MQGDDDYSVSERLWGMIADKLGFWAPILVIRRPESLTIIDYRPTGLMFLTALGFLAFAGLFIFLLFKVGSYDYFGLWVIAGVAVICFALLFWGTIREVYSFDKTTDSYAFVRQFIHRKDVIEGSLGQFTGAYVQTQQNDDSESYFVVLRQEGMFLTGVTEQTLREAVPLFNSFDREARIANAITEFLPRRSKTA
ncbi:MAG TPA: hypothetical protein VNA17_12290 [Pyrinomonadaceae bacterium]|nr:hypothetical protein [Pyrinomonadaceae bacterium]